MSKRVGIGLKPGAQKQADDWVAKSSISAEPEPSPEVPAVIKRLTIDIPEDLHRKLKVKAATEGVRMADLLRVWITEKCAN